MAGAGIREELRCGAAVGCRKRRDLETGREQRFREAG